MTEIVRKIYEQLSILLKQLNLAQKITLSMLGIIIFVSFIGIGIWGTRPDFVTLYANLEEQTTGEIVRKLDEKNIPYKIGPNGTSVMVPSKHVRSLRVELATEGIPKTSSSGYELFDNFRLGVTEFNQKINYQRALETELAKTISSISHIRSARVHIVLPEESVFLEEKEKTSASLVLDVLSNGLSQGQINGIVHLVASSVKGLSAQNITIVDINSNVLYIYEDDDMLDTGLSLRQINIQKQYENSIEKRISSMLDRIFGRNSSVVRVNVKMNFDKLESESEIFLPSEDPILRSARNLEESYSGNNANVPANININTDESNYDKLDETINYEVSKKIEKFKKAPGDLENISIAVILDRTLTEEQGNDLRAAIGSAVGINTTRGDSISLSNFPFDKTGLENTKKDMEQQQLFSMITEIGKNVGLVLLLLFTFFYARSKMKKFQTNTSSRLVDITDSNNNELPSSNDYAPRKPKQNFKKSIDQIISDNPEVFAQILKKWLREG
jgi:flagellar M-ring protein FliF